MYVTSVMGGGAVLLSDVLPPRITTTSADRLTSCLGLSGGKGTCSRNDMTTGTVASKVLTMMCVMCGPWAWICIHHMYVCMVWELYIVRGKNVCVCAFLQGCVSFCAVGLKYNYTTLQLSDQFYHLPYQCPLPFTILYSSKQWIELACTRHMMKRDNRTTLTTKHGFSEGVRDTSRERIGLWSHSCQTHLPHIQTWTTWTTHTKQARYYNFNHVIAKVMVGEPKKNDN